MAGASVFFFWNHFRGSKVDISCAHAPIFELCTGGRCLRALYDREERASRRMISQKIIIKCARNCELKSIFVGSEAISRLQGKDDCLQQRWLCDEVSSCKM